MPTVFPKDYRPLLNLRDTEVAIKQVKDFFERELASALHLTRVSAPLFVERASGLNDNLNGVERPVDFVLPGGEQMEIVHSLAKWKRMALRVYGFAAGEGLYTDMNAIRRDEVPDNLHSIYVDQWDWEKVILREDRNTETLRATVETIYGALRKAEAYVGTLYPALRPSLPEKITFLTAQGLEDTYPQLTPKERETEAARRYGAIFVMGIGGALRGGAPHDGRAPDYDDWSLNGDILVYYPLLDTAFELSSMGIRVSEESLHAQLTVSGALDREALPFHRALLAGELPYTIGGGIGQSRLCMYLLRKAHIGEVQSSYWPKDMQDACAEHHISLL